MKKFIVGFVLALALQATAGSSQERLHVERAATLPGIRLYVVTDSKTGREFILAEGSQDQPVALAPLEAK